MRKFEYQIKMNTDPAIADMVRNMNKEGVEGWELFQVIGGTYFYKREIIEEPVEKVLIKDKKEPINHGDILKEAWETIREDEVPTPPPAKIAKEEEVLNKRIIPAAPVKDLTRLKEGVENNKKPKKR